MKNQVCVRVKSNIDPEIFTGNRELSNIGIIGNNNCIFVVLQITFDYALKGLVDVISYGSDSEGDSEKDFEELGEPTQSKITKYTHTSSVVSNTKTTPADLSRPLPITTSSVSVSTTVHECDANVSGVISSNNLSRPCCSASVSSSFAAEYQNQNSGFKTLKEMFPQLPDGKIFEVFSNSQEIESEKYMMENQEDLCTKIE